MKLWRVGGKGRFNGLLKGLILIAALPAILLIYPTNRLAAQTAASDSSDDAQEARIDAILATPSLVTPVPQTNLFATAPGLEQQAPSPRFTFNFLAPIYFNSNAEAARTGGTATAQISPVAGLSWSAPLFDLPVRLSANLRVESDKFVESNGADLDKLNGSLRLQYVDPTNDQSFSPYLAYAPRLYFAPTFSREVATRQDLNLGFNKIFNFDANFQSLPFASTTQASTIWSFGLTAFAQRRFRDPIPSSFALYLIPSASYVISEQWNVSLGVEVIRRWFDSNAGFSRQHWLIEPIATLEFVFPSSWFGAPGNAELFGRPALDFQTSFERLSSNLPSATYSKWTAGLVLKAGWHF